MKNMIYLVTLALGLSACQSMYVPQAREVKKKPRTGGIIAMPTTYRPEDRLRADELMKQNCAGLAVNVADEGEVVVGQTTQTNTNASHREDSRHTTGHLFGIPVVSGSGPGMDSQQNAVTTQLKEWQIAYDCSNDKASQKARK